jgi:hypothetical protein
MCSSHAFHKYGLSWERREPATIHRRSIVQTVSCPHRSVLDDGRIECEKITIGDREVTPAVCERCPAAACACQHLRFSLEKIALTPITVRRANGNVEVWDDQAPRVSLRRSACALKTVPVSSPADCLACATRLSWPGPTLDAAAAPPLAEVLAENVIPFVRPLRTRAGIPCTSP